MNASSLSRVNAVESFFATLTRRRLRRGVFHSLVDLQAAINLGEHNSTTADPNPLMVKRFFSTKPNAGTQVPVLNGANNTTQRSDMPGTEVPSGRKSKTMALSGRGRFWSTAS